MVFVLKFFTLEFALRTVLRQIMQHHFFGTFIFFFNFTLINIFATKDRYSGSLNIFLQCSLKWEFVFNSPISALIAGFSLGLIAHFKLRALDRTWQNIVLSMRSRYTKGFYCSKDLLEYNRIECTRRFLWYFRTAMRWNSRISGALMEK